MSSIQNNIAELLPEIFSYIQSRQIWFRITLVCKLWNHRKNSCIIGPKRENRYYDEQVAKEAVTHLIHFNYQDNAFILLHSPVISRCSHLYSLTLVCHSFLWIELSCLTQCEYLSLSHFGVRSFPPIVRQIKMKESVTFNWSPPATLKNLCLVCRDWSNFLPFLSSTHPFERVTCISDGYCHSQFDVMIFTNIFELRAPTWRIQPNFSASQISHFSIVIDNSIFVPHLPTRLLSLQCSGIIINSIKYTHLEQLQILSFYTPLSAETQRHLHSQLPNVKQILYQPLSKPKMKVPLFSKKKI